MQYSKIFIVIILNYKYFWNVKHTEAFLVI